MKNSKYRSSLLFVFLSVLIAVNVSVAETHEELDQKRNKLIGYMLGKQLPSIHYSDKAG